MRRSSLFRLLSMMVLMVLLVTTQGYAALLNNYVGDVAVVAWLDGQTVKVALANESTTRKSITIASEGWDQSRHPYFLNRTVVVPARSVIVEAFALSSTWRGEALAIEATAWDRRAVVEVQTQEIFRPNAYVVREQQEVSVTVDLGFLLEDPTNQYLVVDDYYRGLGQSDLGQIEVLFVEGGLRYSPTRRRIEQISPYMMLSMWAPRPRGEVTVFTFSLYRQKDDTYWNYYQDEIPGPTILVYGRDLFYQDNSHLNQLPTPSWDRSQQR